MKRYRAEIKDEGGRGGVGGGGGCSFALRFFHSLFFFFFHALIPETLGAGFPLLPLTISRLLLLLLLSSLSGSDGRAEPAERTGIRMLAARRVRCGKSVARGSPSVRKEPSLAKLVVKSAFLSPLAPTAFPLPPAPHHF